MLYNSLTVDVESKSCVEMGYKKKGWAWYLRVIQNRHNFHKRTPRGLG